MPKDIDEIQQHGKENMDAAMKSFGTISNPHQVRIAVT